MDIFRVNITERLQHLKRRLLRAVLRLKVIVLILRMLRAAFCRRPGTGGRTILHMPACPLLLPVSSFLFPGNFLLKFSAKLLLDVLFRAHSCFLVCLFPAP